MKNITYTSDILKVRVLFIILTFFFITKGFSQIGINTTSPDPSSALDIHGNGTKGLLIPRVQISDLSNAAPLSSSVSEGTLVYNQDGAFGKGFYFWNTNRWSPVSWDRSWNTRGNALTDNTNVVGTTDGQSFILGTNGLAALTLSSSKQLQDHRGTSTTPSYTFETATTTGFFTSGSDILNLGSENLEYLTVSNGASDVITINNSTADINTSIKGASAQNLLSTDATNNAVGIGSGTPSTALHLTGNSNSIRLDGLNTTNHANNNGVNAGVLYTNAQGEIILKPRPVQVEFLHNETAAFPGVPAVVYTSGAYKADLVYSNTFTLTQNALVEFKYQTSVVVNKSSSGTAGVTDGYARMYGAYIVVNGEKISHNAKYFSNDNSGASATANGYFYLNGKGYLELSGSPAGTTYTFEFYGEADGGTHGTHVNFGSASKNLMQVIAYY